MWCDDWAVGDTAAELSGRSYESSARLTTVARITATQIVLSSGGRYRREDGREVGRRSTWETATDLCRPNDPRVVQARVTAATRRLLSGIDQARRANRLSTVDECNQLVDVVEQLLAQARRKITHLTSGDSAEVTG